MNFGQPSAERQRNRGLPCACHSCNPDNMCTTSRDEKVLRVIEQSDTSSFHATGGELLGVIERARNVVLSKTCIR